MDNSKRLVRVETLQSKKAVYSHVEEAVQNLTPRPPARPKWATLSYIAAISHAILASPMKRLSLSEIYRFIDDNYPYFKEGRPRWKNTVRHNLSLHECFVKGELTANQKCCYWRIHPTYFARFSRGDFSRRRPETDSHYCRHFASYSPYAPPSTDARDAATFCNWKPVYPAFASPIRGAGEWYNTFLQRPVAVGMCPPKFRESPRQNVLYLSGLWSKDNRYSPSSQ